MINRRVSLLFIILILVFLLTCCSSEPAESEVPDPYPAAFEQESPHESEQPQPQAEYIKLRGYDARQRIQRGAVLLDVRTQDEFDEVHIPNAILLPDYEVMEYAETVLPDKDQTILVYCRSGVRSERSARELIGLGYTDVYDIGGILDWSDDVIRYGNVYSNFSASMYEDYTVEPYTYIETRSIHDSLPEFTFAIEGIIITEKDSKSIYYGDRPLTQVSKLTITSADGSLNQVFSGLNTSNDMVTAQSGYGIAFEDWNFDGFLDVSLWKYVGGSSRNAPHYYWLWDNNLHGFVMNAELEAVSEWSSLSISDDNKQLSSWSRYGGSGGIFSFFEWQNGQIVLLRTEERLFEKHDNGTNSNYVQVIISELIDGEMVVTDDYKELLR